MKTPATKIKPCVTRQSQQQGKLGAWNNARIEAWNIQTMKAAKDLQHLNNDLTQ